MERVWPWPWPIGWWSPLRYIALWNCQEAAFWVLGKLSIGKCCFMEFAGKLPSEVPEEPAIVEVPFSRTHWCPMYCWMLCTAVASGEKHTETKPLFPAVFSSAICWQYLPLCPLRKEQCFQGPAPGPSAGQWWADLEMRGNHLVTDTR